jgi:hypothetical protein
MFYWAPKAYSIEAKAHQDCVRQSHLSVNCPWFCMKAMTTNTVFRLKMNQLKLARNYDGIGCVHFFLAAKPLGAC